MTQAKQCAQAHLKHFKDRVKEIRDIITDLEKKAEEQRLRAEEAAQAASEVCLQWRLLSAWYFILLAHWQDEYQSDNYISILPTFRCVIALTHSGPGRALGQRSQS